MGAASRPTSLYKKGIKMKDMNKKKLSAAVLSCIAAMSICGSVWAADGADIAAPAEKMEFTLDTMIVTAGRIPTKITDAKADVSVVTRKEIEDMHMTNVEEALRTVPGVQFANYGGGGGVNANINAIRINGSKEIVILVDGVRVTDFQGNKAGYTYTSLLNNIDNIERIEVVRGSAGTLYGSGAKGGVINIITRKIDSTKTTIDIAAGSFDKRSYKLNTTGRREKVGYNVYYDKSKSGDVKDGDGNNMPNMTDTESYGIKLTYDFTPDHTLTLNVDKVDAEHGGYDIIDNEYDNGRYKNTSITLRDDIKFSDKWSNSLSYRHNTLKGGYFEGGRTNIITGMNPYFDYTYNFLSEQATFTTSRHTLVFGFDYSQAKDNLSNPVGYTIDAGGNRIERYGNMGIKNMSYYVQDDWKIIPKVTLTGGLRHDKPSHDGDQDERTLESYTSKSYKLNYDITDNDSIYAGRSDFYIIPDIGQLYGGNYSNPELKPAYGRTTSIGYNKKFDEDNIVTLNWFETKSESAVGFDYGTGRYNNFADAVSRGWNLQYMTQIDENWSANLGWAHLFQHCTGDTFEYGYYPKDLATFGVTYTKDKLTAALNGYYFMRKTNPTYDAMKGWPADNYAVVNLSATYKATKNVSVYAKVDNLFDKLYAEHTNVIHMGGQPGQWFAMPGRSFVVGMQYTF